LTRSGGTFYCIHDLVHVAGLFPAGVAIMGKEKSTRKETKKKPQKTLKERRKEKKNK